MSSSEEPVVTITGLDLTKDKNALEKLQQEKIWFCSATFSRACRCVSRRRMHAQRRASHTSTCTFCGDRIEPVAADAQVGDGC